MIELNLCAGADCMNEAWYQPELWVFSETAEEPTKCLLERRYCSACAKEVDPPNLVTDNEWETLMSVYRTHGLKEPLRRRTLVRWVLRRP